MDENRKAKTVLVIEKEGVIALDLQSTLKNLGFQTVVLGDTCGDLTREIAHLRPELIFVDLASCDDLTLLTMAVNTGLAVVLITADRNPSNLAKARALNASIVQKPFNQSELHEAIELAFASLKRHS